MLEEVDIEISNQFSKTKRTILQLPVRHERNDEKEDTGFLQ